MLNIFMENTNPNISIQDLATIRDLLDLACTRGAYRADEVRSVGEMYEKLTQFLKSVVEQAEAAQQAAQSADQQGESL